ncbi:MAG TPA: SDR family NAD(P)-dependent oxidoreductase, partial [Chloroflexota bacterium]
MVLEGQVAVVTGAGQGIGKAIALRLAREGARVVVADMNFETAKSTAAEIRATGSQAEELRVDVREPDQIQTMVGAAVATFGRIDILVACAGVISIKGVLDITWDEWNRIFDVNTRGMFFTMQAVARQMVKQGSGAIVNIASAGGRGPRPTYTHYA